MMVNGRLKSYDEWSKMMARFYLEWREGHQTMLEHQFRVTLHNGVHHAQQINEWYDRHCARMIAERWPEHREDELQ